jgi:alpha-1,2-mannosyltransferase
MPARPSAANRAHGGARPAASPPPDRTSAGRPAAGRPPAEPAGDAGTGPAPGTGERSGGGRGGSFWNGLGGRRILGLSPAGLIIAAATLLAVGLRAYQLARPGHLLAATEYDDGADFGGALRLVGGAIPYRDFVTVQPPGITVLMAPAALLAKLAGSDAAMAAGRILTAAAGAAAVPLAGRLVRHRGLTAITIACGLLAIYPSAVQSAHTVLLEPWLVLACLAGAVAVFDGGRLAAGTRRLAWGGAAFGFAGAVKVWAIVPVAVIAVLCLPGTRRLLVFIGGVAAGFLIPVVPFAAGAPGQFWNSVIVAQLVRSDVRIPFGYRVQQMAGLAAGHPGAAVLAVAGVLFALLVFGSFAAAWRVTGQRPPPLDVWAAASALLVIGIFLIPDDFYYHYAGFLAPFAGLTLGLSAGRLLADGPGSNTLAARLGPGRFARLAISVTGAAGLAIIVLPLAVPRAENAPTPVYPRSTLEAAIPSGACVATDQASLLIAANRFDSSVPGCSLMVDATGTDYVLGQGRNGLTAGSVPAAEAVWQQAFRSAQYVLLTPYQYLRVAWTPSLTRYFDENFTYVDGDWWPLVLYARNGQPGS